MRKYSSNSNNASYMQATLYALTLAGYPAISVLPILMGIDHRIVSILYRIFVLILAASVFVKGSLKNKLYKGMGLYLFIPFWIMIFLSMYSTLVIHNIRTLMPHNDYWLKTVFVVFIPMLAMFVKSNYKTLKIAYLLSFTFIIMACSLNLYAALIIDPEYQTIGRLSTSTLDPISFGNLGLALITLSVFTNHIGMSKYGRLLFRILFPCIGFFILFSSVARGPVLAFVISILIYLLARSQIKMWLITLLLIIMVAVGIMIIFHSGVGDEIRDAAQLRWNEEFKDIEASQSAGLRIIMFKDAWEQFLSNPVTGSAIVELNTGDSPHNIVIESLMALGIFGALTMVGIISLGSYSAWLLIRYNKERVWIGLIYFQVLVLALASGSIFISDTFWMWSALVITIINLKIKVVMIGVKHPNTHPALT